MNILNFLIVSSLLITLFTKVSDEFESIHCSRANTYKKIHNKLDKLAHSNSFSLFRRCDTASPVKMTLKGYVTNE